MARKKLKAAKRVTKPAQAAKIKGRVPQAQNSNKTGFLDLAAETRNEIYAYWAQEIQQFGIRAKGKAHTTASHPITRLSHLVHKEFCGVLAQEAAARGHRVKVQVVDFNFYSLIAFLHRVEVSAGATYRDFHSVGGRELTIELTFTDEFWKSPPAEGVANWLRYQARSVPDLEYTLRVVKVSDAAKTKEVLLGLTSCREPDPRLNEILLKVLEWEHQDPGIQQAKLAATMPKPKTGYELAVEEYYNAVYAQMDGDRAATADRTDEMSGEDDDGIEIKQEDLGLAEEDVQDV